MKHFNRAIESKPNTPLYLWSRARAHGALQRLDEAKADIDSALDVDPTYSLAVLSQVMLAATQGDATGASEVLENFGGEFEDQAYEQYVRGKIAIIQGNREQALEHMEQALKLPSEYFNLGASEIWLVRYFLHRSLNQEELATVAAKRAAESAMPLDLSHALWIKTNFADDNYLGALATAQEIIIVNPGNVAFLAEF